MSQYAPKTNLSYSQIAEFHEWSGNTDTSMHHYSHLMWIFAIIKRLDALSQFSPCPNVPPILLLKILSKFNNREFISIKVIHVQRNIENEKEKWTEKERNIINFLFFVYFCQNVWTLSLIFFCYKIANVFSLFLNSFLRKKQMLFYPQNNIKFS